MSASHDRELQDWVRTWHAAPDRPVAADGIDAGVRRRIRRLRLWAASEAAVGIIAFLFVGYRFVVEPAVFERLAMALLAVIALGGAALSWWHWRGVWRESALTTSEFLTASLVRSRRFDQYFAIGWVILAAEVAVFVPWIRYRNGGWWAWGFLLAMVGIAVVSLLLGQRWVRRQRESVAAIEREFSATDSAA